MMEPDINGEHSSASKLQVLICSANIGNEQPSPDSIAALIPYNGEITSVLNGTRYPLKRKVDNGSGNQVVELDLNRRKSGKLGCFDFIVIGMQEASFNVRRCDSVHSSIHSSIHHMSDRVSSREPVRCGSTRTSSRTSRHKSSRNLSTSVNRITPQEVTKQNGRPSSQMITNDQNKPNSPPKKEGHNEQIKHEPPRITNDQNKPNNPTKKGHNEQKKNESESLMKKETTNNKKGENIKPFQDDRHFTVVDGFITLSHLVKKRGVSEIEEDHCIKQMTVGSSLESTFHLPSLELDIASKSEFGTEINFPDIKTSMLRHPERFRDSDKTKKLSMEVMRKPNHNSETSTTRQTKRRRKSYSSTPTVQTPVTEKMSLTSHLSQSTLKTENITEKSSVPYISRQISREPMDDLRKVIGKTIETKLSRTSSSSSSPSQSGKLESEVASLARSAKSCSVSWDPSVTGQTNGRIWKTNEEFSEPTDSRALSLEPSMISDAVRGERGIRRNSGLTSVSSTCNLSQVSLSETSKEKNSKLRRLSRVVRSAIAMEDHTRKPKRTVFRSLSTNPKDAQTKTFAGEYGRDTTILHQLLSSRCPSYDFVVECLRGEMRLIILVKNELKEEISDVNVSGENTGIGSVLANKGGIVASLTIRKTRLAFLNAHLQAHEGKKNYYARCSNLTSILGGAKVGKSLYDISISSHHCFVLGDLNYRLKRPLGVTSKDYVDDVLAKIGNNDWKQLREADELLEALKKGECLVGFQTLPCNFPPTFKVKRNENLVYNSQRTPSYTDRVLWKTADALDHNVKPLLYEPVTDFLTSDHKPIRGAFSVFTNAPKPMTRSKRSFGKQFSVFFNPHQKPNQSRLKKTLGFSPNFPSFPKMRRFSSHLTLLQPRSVLHMYFSELQCTDLAPSDANGKANAYIMFVTDPPDLLDKSNGSKAGKSHILGGKGTISKSWQRTKTIKSNLNPNWGKENYHVLLKGTTRQIDFTGAMLLITVVEKSNGTIIGTVALNVHRLVSTLVRAQRRGSTLSTDSNEMDGSMQETYIDQPLLQNGVVYGFLKCKIAVWRLAESETRVSIATRGLMENVVKLARAPSRRRHRASCGSEMLSGTKNVAQRRLSM